jgi:hypothetical protein
MRYNDPDMPSPSQANRTEPDQPRIVARDLEGDACHMPASQIQPR